MNIAGEDDSAFIRTVHVVNLKRARAINHSLFVLDRLPILRAVKNDDIELLIKYLENKQLGMDEGEIESYLTVANKYRSFKCTAELLDYKNKHFRFNPTHGEIRL